MMLTAKGQGINANKEIKIKLRWFTFTCQADTGFSKDSLSFCIIISEVARISDWYISYFEKSGWGIAI